MNVVEQICDIYDSTDFWWREKGQERAYLRGYICQLIDRENLFWVVDDEKVIGLCETWKIDFELLGRIVCKEDFNIEDVDTETGKIAFLVNVWIDKEHRKTRVIKMMHKKWLSLFGDCDYFCGHAQRKTVGMYKIFDKNKLFLK